MGRRRFIAFFICMTACGSATAPAVESGDRRADAASLGRVVCEADGANVVTPRVRPRRDGVHILFRNRVEAIEYYMRAESSSDDNHGGRLRGPTTKDVSSHAPGIMWVACRQRGEQHLPFYEHDDRYDSFEIVDPDDLWVELEPDCSRPEEVQTRLIENAETIEDVADWVRNHFEIEGDRRRPGYPETQWKGDPWVIAEGPRTLAFFHARRAHNGWMLEEARGCGT